jgi:hypothetical protein
MLSRLKRVTMVLAALGLALLAGHWWLWGILRSDDPQRDYAAAVESAAEIWRANKETAERIRGLEERLAAAETEKLKLEAIIRVIKAEADELRHGAAWECWREAKAFLRADDLRRQSGAEDAEYPALRERAEADAKIAFLRRERLHSLLAVGGLLAIIAATYILMPPRKRSPYADYPW